MGEDIDSYISNDYIITLLPIILSHIILPPISFVNGIEDAPDIFTPVFHFLYSNLPVRWRTAKHLDSLALVYEKDLLKKPFFEAGWITHMMVHGSYSHLFNNLSAAIQFGKTIYQNHGGFGLYLLYIIGGVMASYPSDLTKNYSILTAKQKIYSIDSSKTRNWFESLADNTNKFFNHFRRQVFETFRPIAVVGSSGAVCSLMGYQTSVVCKLLALSLHRSYNKNRLIRNNSNPSERISSSERSQIAMLSFDLIRAVLYLKSEFDSLERSSTLDGMPVAHGNHIQGFLFGLAAGAVVDWIIIPIAKLLNRSFS